MRVGAGGLMAKRTSLTATNPAMSVPWAEPSRTTRASPKPSPPKAARLGIHIGKTPARVAQARPNQTTPAELTECAAFVGEFVTAVRTAKKAGKTPEDVAKSWSTPAKFAENNYGPADAKRVMADAQVIWNEIK